MPNIPEGTYYSCEEDNETLSYETPEEAVEYWLDGLAEPGESVQSSIVAHTPVVLRVYNRDEVNDDFVKSSARRVMEHLEGYFMEEYGDPDGGNDIDGHTLLPELEELVRKLVKLGHVWRCIPAGEVTLTADDVTKMMQEYNPDWFKEEKTNA